MTTLVLNAPIGGELYFVVAWVSKEGSNVCHVYRHGADGDGHGWMGQREDVPHGVIYVTLGVDSILLSIKSPSPFHTNAYIQPRHCHRHRD